REELVSMFDHPARKIIGKTNVKPSRLVRHDVTPVALHRGDAVYHSLDAATGPIARLCLRNVGLDFVLMIVAVPRFDRRPRRLYVFRPLKISLMARKETYLRAGIPRSAMCFKARSCSDLER